MCSYFLGVIIFTFPEYVTIFLNVFNLSSGFSYIHARPALFFILFKRTCNIFHPFSVFWHTFFLPFARSSFINILLFIPENTSSESSTIRLLFLPSSFFITFRILRISFPSPVLFTETTALFTKPWTQLLSCLVNSHPGVNRCPPRRQTGEISTSLAITNISLAIQRDAKTTAAVLSGAFATRGR